jgi:glucose/arabinose dehydrogenase
MKVILALVVIMLCALSAEAQVELHPAFPGIEHFQSPVAIILAPDSLDRIFIVEKGGTISMVSHPDSAIPTKKIFLDLRSVVSHMGVEDGLLGLAFHPKYKDNGELFVSYTRVVDSVFQLRISRFVVNPSRDSVLSDSETVIYSMHPPDIVHHGGSLLFGLHGNLFCGIGDCSYTGAASGGGTVADFWRLAQNYQSPAGKLLRFNVDNQDSLHKYTIPMSNPFASDSSNNALKEIYAIGFRNPWKYSFDDSTGRLWLADVGQVSYEEIDLVKPGNNYGWSKLEGNHRFNDSTADTSLLTPPVFEYPHTEGNGCITGGYVYHGTMIPELKGKYIYGDFLSGRIWAFTYEAPGVFSNELLVDMQSPTIFLSTFGKDRAGELFAADFLSGIIYRLTPPLGAVRETEKKQRTTFALQRTMFTSTEHSTMCTIHVSEPEAITISLLDQKGQEIQSLLIRNISAEEHTFDIVIPPGLSSGIYFVRLKTSEGNMTQKIIIEK